MDDDPEKIIRFEKWRTVLKRPDFVLSDRHLAECVAVEYSGGLAYSIERGAWRIFDGMRWADDPGANQVLGKIGELLDKVATLVAVKKRELVTLGSAKQATSIERLLRGRLSVPEASFDSAAYLLNTGSATVDGSGAAVVERKHAREDRLTKLTPHLAFGACPEWLEFVDFVTCGDARLADYLQRVVGYALLGSGDEQIMLFLYGDTMNGKSTFLHVLAHVAGEYAVEIPSELLMESRFPRHSEELMRLKGARLVIASEVPKDARWNTLRLKQLSGGDTITAHNMRENSVSFRFGGTLIMAGNDRPDFDQLDDALKRRIRVVPFNAHVSHENRILNMEDRLKQEADGILAWIIEGLRKWRSSGLEWPPIVEAATEAYFEEQDRITSWADECCEVSPLATVLTPISVLFNSYREWCKRNGHEACGINQLSEQLGKSWFDSPSGRFRLTRDRTKKTRGFRGISIQGDTAGEGELM